MNAVNEKSNICLLLVEDNPSNRLACKRTLMQRQDCVFVIFEAETGSQGIKLARTQQLDCILLGHHLPDMNGTDFLSELAEDTGELSMPVFMLTESGNPGVVIDTLKVISSNSSAKTADTDPLQWLSAEVLYRAREQQALRDRSEALGKLRGTEAKYRTLVEQMPVITYIASLETLGKLLYVSPQVSQLGFAAEDLLGDPQGLLKRVYADDLSVTIQAYAHTYENHVPLRCEYRLQKQNGEIRWFLDEANLVSDDVDGLLFLKGVLVDITKDKETEQELLYYRQRLEELVAQRTVQLETQCTILKTANANMDQALVELRQANSALRTSEKRFRLLLESVGEGILGMDTEGRCTFVNRAALGMLAYAEEDLLGQDIHAMLCQMCADNLPIHAREVRAPYFKQGLDQQRCIEIFRRKDGQSFPVECSSYPIELNGQVDSSVLVFWDMTESQAQIQSLAYKASHDSLTGLANRTEFEQRVARVLNNARSNRAEYVLCFLDIDHFKRINDSCGHAAGDELLCALSGLLSTKLRQRDTLARLGGDEFVILLEHTTLDQAQKIANELCQAIGDFDFTWDGKNYSVSASIGIAALNPAIRDVNTFLNTADTACYTAKNNGRNRLHVFNPNAIEGRVNPTPASSSSTRAFVGGAAWRRCEGDAG